jgi:hypothetical protein
MTSMMKRMIFIPLFVVFLMASGRTQAQTINAASCNASDVQAALNSVKADGTTVVIPACSSTTWSSQVTYNQVYSTTLQGSSTVTGSCTPTSPSCTPTDGTTINFSSTSGQYYLQIATAAGKSFRMTGLTFTMPSGGSAAYGQINIKGSSTAVRIDHCHFNDQVNGDHMLQLDGWNGVIDHNFFDSTNQSNLFFLQTTALGASGAGHESWAAPDGFGSGNFMYVENNLFQNGTFVYDNDFGGHIAFRFNIVATNSRVQTHGTGSARSKRGGRVTEIYGNTFTFSTTPGPSDFFSMVVDFESGVGMFWGNTSTGFANFIQQDTPRTNNLTYPQTAAPAGWGYCSSSAINGVAGPSNWDGNTSGQNGYPCLDQVGRGQGQLLKGLLSMDGGTGILNGVTGAITWPQQALSPIYVWLNNVNQVPSVTTHYWENTTPVASPNVDYYLGVPNLDDNTSFNGTAGIGQGPLASKPSTCTPGVGWWASDQGSWNSSGNGIGNGVLYLCTASNTWAASYTPYAYPHPLIQGTGGGSGTGTGGNVAAPTGLGATVLTQ